MPRRERTVRPRSIVAAAKNYTIGRSDEKISDSRVRNGEEWQRAGWDFFDTIPEYHQGCTIVGSLLSRAKLVALEKGEDGTWAPTENKVVLAALDELYGGDEGQVEMLRRFGIHFTVAGGGYLIGPGDEDDRDNPDKWMVAASTEVSKTGNTWKVNGKKLEGNPLVVEIWKPHPRNPKKYDSPTRAILPILSELLQLTKRVAAQIDSRLFGAGLLLVPSETSFPAAPVREINPGEVPAPRDSVQPGDAQGLADLLFHQAQLAIANPESAAAMIPVIGEAPGEYIGNVKHITFWSELDRMAPKLREEGIRRTALGMDMPPEVLLGNAGSNHWNMWLSDENSVKIHAEPLLKILTASLTTGYLRNAIDGEEGVDDANRFAIGADTSQMRLRPNRSKEALELNRDLKLSDAAALRENGFDPADAMDDDGIRMALLRKVASGSTTPELVAAALRILGVAMPEVQDNRPPAEARPDPTLEDHPTRDIPDPASQAAAVDGFVFAAEQMLDRALQRAGNRMKTKLGLKGNDLPANRVYTAIEMSPADINDALQDAWSCVYEFDYGVDADRLGRALDMYARGLLRSRQAPTRGSLASALNLLMSTPEG
ncbi:portal protein [Microbacterium phage Fregley]|nr:portal protein [Microbacterium phage Fregley]